MCYVGHRTEYIGASLLYGLASLNDTIALPVAHRLTGLLSNSLTLFECHHVRETVRERKRKFLQKFRMSSNQLCV